MKILRSLLAVGLSACLAAAPAFSQPAASGALTRIGAAAAVHGLVQAMATGAAVGRVIQSGKPLFLNDHVTTDAQGRLQVMLLDETIFTIGPDSDMVLDEFVYDPATSAGKVTARVTKGVFRFVTGKVARKDPANMRVNLPVGTIGIRGTIAGGEVGEHGATVVLLGPGAHNNADEPAGRISVGNAGQTVIIERPGFGTTLQPGQPPAAPTEMRDFSGRILQSLQPKPEKKPASAAPQSAPASQQAGPATAEPASGSEQAGQTTAQGSTLVTETQNTAEITQSLGTTTTQASQDITAASALADGPSTWDQIISNVPTGTGFYNSANGSFPGGYWYFNLSVDFGARNITGSAYTQGSGYYDYHYGFSAPFGAAGTAAFDCPSTASNGNAFNYNFAFQNKGGQAAADVIGNVKNLTTGETGSPITATRQASSYAY